MHTLPVYNLFCLYMKEMKLNLTEEVIRVEEEVITISTMTTAL